MAKNRSKSEDGYAEALRCIEGCRAAGDNTLALNNFGLSTLSNWRRGNPDI